MITVAEFFSIIAITWWKESGSALLSVIGVSEQIMCHFCAQWDNDTNKSMTIEPPIWLDLVLLKLFTILKKNGYLSFDIGRGSYSDNCSTCVTDVFEQP